MASRSRAASMTSCRAIALTLASPASASRSSARRSRASFWRSLPAPRQLRGLGQELELGARVRLALGAEEHDARGLLGLAGLAEQLGRPREIAPQLGGPCRRGLPAFAEDTIEERHREEVRLQVRGPCVTRRRRGRWAPEPIDGFRRITDAFASMANQNRLGELLVREKLISLAQLRQAQDEQNRSGQNLGYTLARLGFISDQEITNFLSQQYRVPTINLEEYEIDAEILKLVSKEQCEKHRVIPVSRAGSSLIVAMADPTNLHAIDDLKFLTGYNIEPVIASESAIAAAVERYYSAGPSYDEVMAGFEEAEIEFSGEEEDLNVLELEKASEDAPVVRLVNMILLNAIKKGASDIHIEPYEKKLRVRYRVDGVLIEEMTPPLKLKNAIASRLKIMSQLDIAERRLPQDGRIKLKLGKGREMDFRVSVLPTLWGEKIVMRLLDKGNLQLDMTKLGFDQKPLDDFLWAIHQPWGMVLVTGPTGSGKTTTLYSALSDLNKTDANISTAEDPGRVQPPRHQPGADARRDRPELRDGAARLPPAGPGHHHGRRDPRLRDRGNRGQGRAHGPLGALDAPHQRRARDDLAPPQHGRRAVPHHGVASTSFSPSVSRARCAPTASSRSSSSRRRSSISASRPSRWRWRRAAHEGRRLPHVQRHRATRAASRSTRSCASPTR